jgi:catechol 2,3-dioxygenase-like lactoylglutathione lyase family enzyme
MRQGEADGGRIAVLVVAGALCVGAAVLIANVAGGSHFGETTFKLIYVALGLALFGANAAAGMLLAARRPRLAGLGYLTASVAALTFVLVVIKILDESFFLGGDWELQGVGAACTVALAQISIVLAFDRSDDPPAMRLLTTGTVLVIVVVAVFAAVEVVERGSTVAPKTFAVLATLYLLAAALTLLFRLVAWNRRQVAVGSVPLDHVVIAVSDRAAAVRFYTTLLGAEVVERSEGRIAFRVGEQMLNVHEPGLPGAPRARDPVRPGNSDLCFAWPASPQLAVELIGTIGAELVEGPVPRVGARGPGQSVYCRDPDGSLIELVSYE